MQNSFPLLNCFFCSLLRLLTDLLTSYRCNSSITFDMNSKKLFIGMVINTHKCIYLRPLFPLPSIRLDRATRILTLILKRKSYTNINLKLLNKSYTNVLWITDEEKTTTRYRTRTPNNIIMLFFNFSHYICPINADIQLITLLLSPLFLPIHLKLFRLSFLNESFWRAQWRIISVQ